MASDKVIFGKLLQSTQQTSIFEGIYKRTNQRIIIKQYKFHQIAHVAQGLKEQFCQAKLHHARFCNILDVLFSESEAGYELCLCLEKLEKDLNREIIEKAHRGDRYREAELWEFLQGTVEALALAQDLVICI